MCKGDVPGKQERNTSGICAENRAGNGRDYERNTSVKVAEYALKIGRGTDWITRGNRRRIGGRSREGRAASALAARRTPEVGLRDVL